MYCRFMSYATSGAGPTSFRTGFYMQTSATYTGTTGAMYRRGFAFNNSGLVGTDGGYGRAIGLAIRCMEWSLDIDLGFELY